MYPFHPHVSRHQVALNLLLRTAKRLSRTRPEEVEPIRGRMLAETDKLNLEETARLQLYIALSTLCDLRAHGWRVLVKKTDTGPQVSVAHPDRTAMKATTHKQQVRESLLIERNAQLSEPSTRKFIAGMERKKKHGTKFRSVFSLLRDGQELATLLRQASELPRGSGRNQALRQAIDPYIQVVESGVECEHTGLDLQHIWRYFRHTWVTPYRSVPGRQISFLIRDRAAENHPIIGIGSLASSVVQQKHRDRWIGWHPTKFLERVEREEYRTWPRWTLDQLRRLIDEIYLDDFLKEGLIDGSDLKEPSEPTIAKLRQEATRSRKEHRLYSQKHIHKGGASHKDSDWQSKAESYLFRAKRAGRLADLLRTRRDLIDAGFTKTSPKRLREAMDSPAGLRAIRTVLRYVKAAHVGIDMMDISVCGAVDPYRPILGGKLVSLLLASPAVVEAYNARYRGAISVIASSMAGRAVRRRPHLVLLMTTSLYQVAAAQYNRLKVNSANDRLDGTLEYKKIEYTAGFGSYHFSNSTIDAMEILLARAEGGRQVNSIFGEGVNPKLRKIRGALEAVGLPSDHLLKHGAKRLIYAVPLASNFDDVLIGRAQRPRYIVEQSERGTEALIDFWFDRWLTKRIERDGVLEEVAAHSTAYPIEHGARVTLPPVEEEDLGPLFESKQHSVAADADPA